MGTIKNFLQDKKVTLIEEYQEALDQNRYHLAKDIRTKLRFIDELIGGVIDDQDR